MSSFSGGSAHQPEPFRGRQATASHLQASVPTLLQALSASESAVPQLIIEAASPRKILLTNRAWCALTGYASEEVVGQSASMLHGPLTCRETLSALGLAMASGRSGGLKCPCSQRPSAATHRR